MSDVGGGSTCDDWQIEREGEREGVEQQVRHFATVNGNPQVLMEYLYRLCLVTAKTAICDWKYAPARTKEMMMTEYFS